MVKVRPGHEADFDETAKLYKSTLGQAKIDAPWVTYGVMAGIPGPTYLVFIPHRTLAEIEAAHRRTATPPTTRSQRPR